MNPLLTAVSPNALTMIRLDHTRILGEFRKLKPGTSATVRQATANHICAGLEIHAQLEEEIFYPALRATGVQLAALDRSVAEHDEMRSLIGALRPLAGDDPQQPKALAELMRVVLHHVADEETLVLQAAEERLAEQLGDLGARMTERRFELAKPRAGELAAELVQGAPVKTALFSIGTLAVGALLVGGLRRLGSRRSRWS